MPNDKKISDQKGSKTAILQMLRMHGPMPRIELTRWTELSRASVSLAINELTRLGLVRETETLQSGRGRPATNLELVPDAHAVLGADLNDQMWTLGAFDLLGGTIATKRIPFSPNTPQAAVSALKTGMAEFMLNVDKNIIQVIGLGVPGLVDTHRGLIRSSAVLGWQDVELGAMLQRELGWPAVVLNRSRARGLSECRFGAGREYRDMIYIGVDSGIGAGVYVNRELIHGALGGAGEIGHMTVVPDGPVCLCGNQGCLQMLAAAPAMQLEARRLLRTGAPSSLGRNLEQLQAEDVCRAADEGDELARNIVVEAATYLGVTMANLVNLLNPEAIILGGWVPKQCATYVSAATQAMNRHAISLLSSATVVRTGMFAEIGSALGAAQFALDKHMSFASLYPVKQAVY